jgi:hypothetical protein
MPTIELNLAEPDWLDLSGGRWTPWVEGESGEPVWNPSRGFNTWITSIPEGDKAWLDYADLFWSIWVQINPRAFSGLPDEFPRDSDENGLDDWVEIRSVLDDFDFRWYIDQLRSIGSRPYLGAPMLDHMPADMVEILNRHGLGDRADPYDQEWDDRENPGFAYATHSGYSFPFSAGRWIHATMLGYLTEQGRIDAFVDLFESLFPLYRLRLDETNLISAIIVIGAEQQYLDTLRWALCAHPERFSESHLRRLQAVLARYEHLPVRYTHELVAMHDSARRQFAFTDEGDDGSLFRERLSVPYQSLPVEIRELVASFEDRTRAAVESARLHELDSTREPWHRKRYEELSFGSGKKLESIPWGYHINYNGFIRSMRARRASNQALRIIIATYRHRLRHGRFPATLEDFDADLIGFEHTDPFVRGGLMYQLRDELGPVVYARGYDGDDDGGRHNDEIHLGSSRSRSVDGDFVFFPDPHRTQAHLIEASED